MTITPNSMVGLRSTEIRSARSVVRRQLRGGSRSLEDVLSERPACLNGVMLFTLLSWRRGWGRDSLRKIGALAVRERINLAMPVELAGQRTIGWLAELDRTTGTYAKRPVSSRYEVPS